MSDELPKTDERVRFRCKGDTVWETGVVVYYWPRGSTFAGVIRTDDGRTLVALADEIERVAPAVGGVPEPEVRRG